MGLITRHLLYKILRRHAEVGSVSGRKAPSRRRPGLPAAGLLCGCIGRSPVPPTPGGLIAFDDAATRLVAHPDPIYATAGAWQTALAFTLFGLYLVITLLFLLYWSWQRGNLRALSMGLLALVMAVRTLAVAGGAGLFDIDLNLTIEAATFFLLVGLPAFLLWAHFPQAFLLPGRLRPSPGDGASGDGAPVSRTRRLLHTVAAGLALAVSGTFSVAALWASPGLLSLLTTMAGWFALALLPVVVSVLIPALRHAWPLARPFAAGFALMAAAGVHDFLLMTGWVPGTDVFFPYAMPVFILLLSAAVVRKNARIQRDARHLKETVAHRSKELRAAAIAMQASRLAEGQFLAAVSHELRTPLSAILGYAQMLEGELQEHLEPRHREFFQTIRVSAERLLLLLNEVLDLARLEAGKAELNAGLLEVRPLVEDTLRQLHPLLAQKALSVETHFDPGATHVYADAMGLRQVLINLIANAVKFTEKGGLTIRVTATTLHDRPALAIAVADTGPGIAPDFLPYLFDRFTRERRLYGKHQGSGLGLAISRELVVHMGGRIDVESERHRGSVFTVVLPCTAPEQPQEEDLPGAGGIRHKHDRRPARKR